MGYSQEGDNAGDYSVLGLTEKSGIMEQDNESTKRIQKWVDIVSDFFDPNNPDNDEMDDLTRAQLSEFVANFMEGANDAEATYRKHYCQMVVNKIHHEFGYEGLCELMLTMDKRAGWISDILIESPDLDEILFKKYNVYDDDIASKARETVAMQDLNGKIWRLRRKYSRLIVEEVMANVKPKA